MALQRYYIDVGGCVFTTSEDTLRKIPYIAILIDQSKLAENEVLFVDRDPMAFSYILMWVRSQIICLGREDDEYINYLMSEVVFYGVRRMESHLVEVLVSRKKSSEI